MSIQEQRKLFNAIKDALIECDKYPSSSVVDIFNEKLEQWESAFRMANDFYLETEQ